MGSCGESAMVDNSLGGSVIEQHLCSEIPEQLVSSVQECYSEEACNVMESNVVDLSVVTDGCVGEGHVGSASCVDVTEGSGDALHLVSEAENAEVLPLEKTAEDDCQSCLGISCGNIDVSCPKSGSEGNFRDEGNFDLPSESLTANDLQRHCALQEEQKDDKSNVLPSAGNDSAVVEGENNEAGALPDAFNCVLDFRHSEMPLESESTADLLVDCDQQNEQDEIMRNADPLSNVLEKCDALIGKEADVLRQISPSLATEVPSGALCTDTEIESTSDQPHDQKDSEDQNSAVEGKIKDFVDEEINTNSCVKIPSSPACHVTLRSSPVVDSLCEPALLDPGYEMKNGMLQIEDNFCKSKDCISEETTNSSFRKPFYPESGQPTVALIISCSTKDVPDLHSKANDIFINNNSAVDNPGLTDSDGKVAVGIDCVTESIPLPSQRNSRRTKFGCKTQTKKASRKCKNKAKVTHPGGVMKINLEAARKKRSCFSKPARSSTWGLIGNIKQFFEQDNEVGVGEAMFQELGKATSKHQSGKVVRNDASTSSLSSVQKCSVSTTRVRLKIKFGKEIDLSYSNVLIPEAADGLGTASCLGSGSGSQKVSGNVEDKSSEAAAIRNLESFNDDLHKDGLVLNGQVANSHIENTEVTEKSDGHAELLCLSVPPEKAVEALIEPISTKGMDPGTSPDSEVINTIPEIQVGERHQEDVHHAILGSNKELNSNLDVTIAKRGKKKDKLVCSSNCITEDGSQGQPGNNRAKHSKNHRHKKNCSDAVNSLELPTLTKISKSVSSKELSMESLPLSGETELAGSTEALKVKNHMEVKATCKPSVDHGLSESQGSENLLSSARSLGSKLPKSLGPSKVSKTKSKASDPTSRKKTTSMRKEKQRKPISKSGVKGKGASLKVTCEVEDHPLSAANVVGNHKLETVGKVSVNVSNLDKLSGVGLGEQLLSPRNAWVRCDDCHKWRRIPAALADLIDETNCTWTCKDSSDKAFADCAIPQEKSNAEINTELGLSDASGEEDAYEGFKNYKELEYRPPLFSQESTFTRIFTNEFLHRSHKTQTIDEIMVCHCKPPQDGKLGCGDECLNRMLNIECVQGTCPCVDRCSNQQFQKRKYASLKWFKCGKKGYGLKAIEDVAKGQFLIEYVGEVLDMQAYEARQREYALKGHRHFYFMTLNGSEVIDASAKGNLGRFINHSCDPNCRTEKWMVNGEICIGLFALREIKKDEELTFDYNYVRVFGAAAKKCYCGSPHCQGYIGGGDPLDAALIVQSDSDEEFPEPVMLTEDGEIEDAVPIPEYFDNVDTQSARHMLHDRDVLDKSTTAIDADGSPEIESSMNNPASAVSLLHSSVEMEDSKGKLPSSVQVEEISQQMEDVTSKPMPTVKQEYAMESECADKTSIERLETTSSLSTVSKVFLNSTGSNRQSKSEIIEGRDDFSQSRLLVKTPKLDSSIKKGKVRVNPPNGLKAEVTTANRLQVSSIKHKKVEGSSNGRFEAVQGKLNELLDGDGGISKRKDATKGYLKLLFLTVASGDRSNGEAIQSNRDLSMILDALLKTKSRAVLNDIINKNGLQMLHNIMKQYRQDFKKIPILRKLLKVLEYLAASKILTSEQIYGGPPCRGMESFRESMLSLTEHDDKQVHQIARSFRDRWFPRPVRKHGYVDRDDNRVESHRSFNCNRFSVSQNHRHEQDVTATEATDCSQQSMLVTTSGDTHAQDGCPALSQDGVEIKGAKKSKRKSRWDQPAETNSHSDMVISSIGESQSIQEDVPPGFSCPVGSLNSFPNSGNVALQNASLSGCPSDLVIGHPREKFNSRLPVSYGIPWSVAQQYGTPHAEFAGCWATAPGMPFNPFPPLPPYPRDNKDCQPSNSTNAMTIDQPAEVKQCGTGGTVNCYSDDMIPSTTGANPEDLNLSCEDDKHISKRLKDDSNDLGTRYFRQQKWNNTKIHRPWFRRNAWKCTTENNSSGDICSIDVGDVPKESKVICEAENAICREEKGGNNIY